MNKKRIKRIMTWRRYIVLRSVVMKRGEFKDGTPFEVVAWVVCKPPTK